MTSQVCKIFSSFLVSFEWGSVLFSNPKIGFCDPLVKYECYRYIKLWLAGGWKRLALPKLISLCCVLINKCALGIIHVLHVYIVYQAMLTVLGMGDESNKAFFILCETNLTVAEICFLLDIISLSCSPGLLWNFPSLSTPKHTTAASREVTGYSFCDNRK